MDGGAFSLPRRDLLKGGALVVGFALARPALAQAPPGAGPPPATPDPNQVDTWLAIHKDNTATLYLGFVELGQGTTTALPQVAAEELDLDLDQIRVAPAETNVTPNQGGTYSSASIARGSPQVRAAAAEARLALLTLAVARLGAPADQLEVSRGVVLVKGDRARRVTYGQLIGDRRFEVKVTGKAPVKKPDQYRLVGTKAARRDLPAKVFAPGCALADVRADGALVICTSQDIYNLRRELSVILGLAEPKIRVQFKDASGTYGHSCYDDVAQAAAIASQLAGRPVRLQFMRSDEHGWDTYGPAHLGDVKVAAGADGRIVAYQYDGWQHNWSQVEAAQQLAMGTAPTEWPTFPSQQVSNLTCGGQYAIPNIKLLNHHVPGQGYLRGAWLRSPLDLSFAFTSEQAIDQLAYKLGRDPYEFRRLNIADERWLGVLDAAAKAAGWTPRRAASSLSDAQVVTGRGIGLGTHLASWGGAVAEIEVDKSTGRVRIKHLYGAIDAGLVVNPGNVEAQVMGQLVQTASRMLFEEVTFDEHGVTSLDWQGYPVIRFQDCPEVTPVIVQRLNEKSLGAGEEVMAAAAGAIANAFFDATGRRLDQYPLTPERVKAALAGPALV